MSTATAVAIERVGDVFNQVGESPLWSAAESALYWVDIEGRGLHRWHPGSGRSERWATAARIACIALHAGGGLVAAMERSLFRVRPKADGLLGASRLAGTAHAQPGMRFNDGRCDREGRFWVGTMVMDMALAAPAGVLLRLDARGTAAATTTTAGPQLSPALVEGLLVPNGLAFSPDGRTLYLSDSHPTVQTIWAFDLAPDGTPTARRVFVDMRQHAGRPDGAAIDTDGAYWTCANDGGAVHRFTPEGRLDRTIALPVSKPSMCTFGGAQMDELYITSIRPAQVPAAEADLAGGLFVCRPGAQGIAETPFGG
jgi:sugar lactone lactonase YvrE